VRLSTDRSEWVEVARNDQNNRAVEVNFSPRSARYIRIEQTGRADRWWWSIHEAMVKFAPAGADRTRWKLSASHNNVLAGADHLAQVLDGRPETRWSSRAGQQPGMWFEVDLDEIRTIRGVVLDTTGSPNDYPRGYIVRLSTNRIQWIEAARNDRNNGALDVSFNPTQARYIRIEQTGSADSWWWSIHEVNVKV
jgi:hypothetical protein